MSNMFNAEAIKSAQAGFRNSLGSPVKSLAHAAFLINACAALDDRNTTPIVRMISQAKERGRDNEAGAVWKLFTQVFEGAKRSKDKNGNPTIKISGITPDMQAMEQINHLVGLGKSINSKEVKALYNSAVVKREFDPKGWAERYVKAHSKAEIAEQQAKLKAQLAALEQAAKS